MARKVHVNFSCHCLITNYCNKYSTPFDFEKALEAEKIFDNLSIISSHETPQQWADRVRSTLRILINEKYSSYYHVFCLFGSFGQARSNRDMLQ